SPPLDRPVGLPHLEVGYRCAWQVVAQLQQFQRIDSETRAFHYPDGRPVVHYRLDNTGRVWRSYPMYACLPAADRPTMEDELAGERISQRLSTRKRDRLDDQKVWRPQVGEGKRQHKLCSRTTIRRLQV